MIDIAGPTVSPIANPEALINAAIAANAAAQSAYQAFVISMITLAAIVISTLSMIMVAVKFGELEKNTNSMKDALVDATRKLALIEGRTIGVAEQKATQATQATKED